MADCKACGAWFESTTTQDLCPTCKRALMRLGNYVAPVVRCKDCKRSYEDISGRTCAYGAFDSRIVPDEFFCAYGE